MTTTRTATLTTADAARPLHRRFPALAGLPHVALVEQRTPVERSPLADRLWLKREDLAADVIGGNKVRSLEYLLGDVAPGDRVLTVGARGSTHALATVRYVHQLGGRAELIRWPQEMNRCAARVAQLNEREADSVTDAMHPVTAYARVAIRRALAVARRDRLAWIPGGGSSALGILGHVNAALELAEQVEEGALPPPERVIVALGSGGTMAGIALGLAIAGIDATVVGVRVVPKIVGNRRRVLSLARAAAELISRHTGARVAAVDEKRIGIDDGRYGGAYGRETEEGRRVAAEFAGAHGWELEPTYTAKAFAAALDAAREMNVVFWSTFDWRCLAAAANGER